MKKLATFISGPKSAAQPARAARKRGMEPHVPTEGEDWTAIRADLMETAQMLLAVYCRSNSIDDAECQRIADRINYEHSEKNHLKNPHKLKSSMDVVVEKVRKIRNTKAEADILRIQKRELERAGHVQWRLLRIGETIKEGDEQTHRSSPQDEWFQVSPFNIGRKHDADDLRFRRRCYEPITASSVDTLGFPVKLLND